MTWQLANGLGSGSAISVNFLRVPIPRPTSALVRNPDSSRTPREVEKCQERKHSQPLRKAAAGLAETICVTIGEILRAFTPTECANYFPKLRLCPILKAPCSSLRPARAR